MNEDTRFEMKSLQDLAAPGRYRVEVSKDDECFIPGRLGIVEWHAFDNQTFSAYSTSPKTIKILLSLDWVIPFQRGDKELRILFPRNRFEELAKVLKLKTKRKAPAHLKAFQFTPGLQPPKRGQISMNGVENDSVDLKGSFPPKNDLNVPPI